MILSTLSDEQLLEALGRRIARYRLNQNLTQSALAEEAGVSLPTLQRMEAGRSSQTSNLIRVLRALGKVDNLNALLPEPVASPMQLLEARGRVRRRASSTKRESGAEPWSWEDDA